MLKTERFAGITSNGWRSVLYGDDFASFTLPSYMNNYSRSMGSPNISDANDNSLLEGAVDTGQGQGGNFAFGGLRIRATVTWLQSPPVLDQARG